LIFTDNSIPKSMNPSKDDAIFVSQSRTIMNLSMKEPCIIIGRCANWILRNDKNSFHVFVCSDIEFACRRIMESDHLTEAEAKQKILQVNKARANHYWEYTDGNWTDIRQYDLVINSSKVGIDEAVEMIEQGVKRMR
jgi:cytidylate kinase